MKGPLHKGGIEWVKSEIPRVRHQDEGVNFLELK